MDYTVEAKDERKISAGIGRGGFGAGAASVLGSIALGPEWVPMGFLGVIVIGMPGIFWGIELLFGDRSFASLVADGKAVEGSGTEAFIAAVEQEYGVKLSEASAFSLLQKVKISPSGRWKLKEDTLSGGLHRFGTAIQVSGNEPFHVQLAWDGEKFLLLDVADDPESVTEFRKRESVSF